jgi:hypothetical protein
MDDTFVLASHEFTNGQDPRDYKEVALKVPTFINMMFIEKVIVMNTIRECSETCPLFFEYNYRHFAKEPTFPCVVVVSKEKFFLVHEKDVSKISHFKKNK